MSSAPAFSMRKLIDKLRNHIWILTLIAAFALLGLGVFRGEAIEVFEKARIICLECVGIG